MRRGCGGSHAKLWEPGVWYKAVAALAAGGLRMFIVETSRSKTLANVAAILIGLLVGFPYLLFTVHLYGKPSPPIPPAGMTVWRGFW